MKRDRLKPRRRFVGFKEEWEQCDWIDTVDISTNMVDPKSGKYDHLPHIGPGNIESFTGQLYNNIRLVKDEGFISGKFIFNNGDIIYGKINPQLAKYVYAQFNGLTSADAYVLRAKENLDQKFLYSILQTNNFYNYTVSVSKRSGMPKVNRDELNAYVFYAPSEISEQSNIGKMFLCLDNLIKLQKSKLSKLKAIKKAYLYEMFPQERENIPKRRFSGFTDAWEQRKLGDISDVTKLAGFEFTKYVTYADEGEVIALRGLNVKNGSLVLDEVKYIDGSDFTKLNRSKLYKNDILFTYVGTVGELAVVPEDDKYYLAPNVARIRMNAGANPLFVCQQMNDKTFYNKIILPLIATSSQPALSMENVRKFTLMLPSEEEQSRISDFLESLDFTITLQQRKIEKLQELKQAYLNDMFV